MAWVLCDRTSLQVKGSGQDEPASGAGEIAFVVPLVVPDLGAVRWNGNDATPDLRPSTAQELADDADAEKDTKADLPDEILKAFALVMLDEINELRAVHGRATITRAQLKAAVKAKL